MTVPIGTSHRRDVAVGELLDVAEPDGLAERLRQGIEGRLPVGVEGALQEHFLGSLPLARADRRRRSDPSAVGASTGSRARRAAG